MKSEAAGRGCPSGFVHSIKLALHGARVGSGGWFLTYRELDDPLHSTALAIEALADSRTSENIQHALMALPRQSVFSRFAASTSQRSCFETEVLTRPRNVKVLIGLRLSGWNRYAGTTHSNV